MTGRLSCGRAELDEVLGGGLPTNGINLVIGAPGSGKTILAQQYLFHNAAPDRRGLYVTTVSEPLDKLVRFGQSLGFFDVARIGGDIVYEDLGAAMQEDGLAGALERLVALLREYQPGLLVIDSFKALGAFAADEREFRSFLHELAGRLTARAVSSFWIGEYEADAATRAPEFAVADAIVALGMVRTAARQMRVLQVLKLRGSGFLSGEHAYRITAEGLRVFPRLADPIDRSSYATTTERVSTGIDQLDEALGGGFWPGSATLVAGPSGAGKTVTGLHFAFAGGRAGEPALYAALQEDVGLLDRLASGFGWDLAGAGVHVMARSPVDMYVDEWVYDLLDQAGRTGARRIVIDSLSDLALATSDDLRFREYIYSLMRRCARAQISLLFTLEIRELFAVTQLSDLGISHLADNVVLLQYVRRQAQVSRAVTVLKTRASAHDHGTREYQITPEGIHLGEPLAHPHPAG